MWDWLLIAVGAILALYALVVLAFVVGGRREDARAIGGLYPRLLRPVHEPAARRTTPKTPQLLVVALIPYLAMPFDLIPDFIPVAGQLDDAILVAFVLRRVVKHEPGLVKEHWPGPPSSLTLILRLAGQ